MSMSAPLVVGVDGRPAALRAVAWAAREADRRRLPLDLVAVVPDDVADPPATVQRAQQNLIAARRAALATAAVVTSAEVASGVPSEVLAHHGAGASLLVLGADDHRPDDADPGAMSSATILAASCPVVVVPTRWGSERHLGEVVVAVDPAEPDELRYAVVGLAADVARHWHRPLLIAVVLPGAHRAPDVGTARRVFDACTDEVGPDVAVHEVLAHGDPTEELLGLVGPSTGLLVLGEAGRGPGTADAVGSAVLSRARAPIAVVPAPAASPSVFRVPAAVGVGRSA